MGLDFNQSYENQSSGPSVVGHRPICIYARCVRDSAADLVRSP